MKQLVLFLVILLIALNFVWWQKQRSCEKKEVKQIKKFESGDTLIPSKLQIPLVSIDSGSYKPLYGNKQKPVKVAAFKVSVFPVTNSDFLLFVKQNPKWRKSTVKKIFAEENYLAQWKNDTTLADNMNPDAPVTNVSWYAANAYCSCYGLRLPTVDEWEYVAMADELQPDARTKKTFNQYILSWYEKRGTYKNPVGSTFKNVWGVYDMHGLVWEWTSDFNSILINGENRSNPESDKNLFCGSGSLGASDLMNYAAFMRYAFRGSIKANYTVQNLGFRCAK